MPSKNSAAAVANGTMAVRIACLYNLDVVELLVSQKGYRNTSYPLRLRNGRTVNLILYKSESDIVRTIRNANAVSEFLTSSGLPVRYPVDARIVRLGPSDHNRYAALYNYLPGGAIAWEAYSQKHLKLLGKAMSDMHAALRRFDAAELIDVESQYQQIAVRMRLYFASTGVREALAVKLGLAISPAIFDDIEKLLQACKRLPGRQALHMDFVRSNVLFGSVASTPTITGILDFEKTACGHPLFDIARTLAFLLVDCKYKPAAKTRKYFLHSGYQKRGAATFRTIAVRIGTDRINVLEGMLSMFLLHDFYKFLRHNPYDSLMHNEHFVRTRDALLQRSCLLEIKLLQ